MHKPIDRKKFFDGIRGSPFGAKLTSMQVKGITAILDLWEKLGLTDLRWLAYILATIFHETGQRMEPIIETTGPKDVEPVSVDTAIRRLESAYARGKLPWVKKPYWRKDKNGLSWIGRGPVQTTHEANYAWAEKETGIPFTKNPELMLVMEHALPVCFIGMIKGKYASRKVNGKLVPNKLSDYFDGDKADWYNARRIINSVESAEKVAGIAKSFYVDLMAAS